MGSWCEGPLLGFDTETTGVDVGTDRIVTAALVRRDAGGTSQHTWIIDPGVEIPAAASAVHGISTGRARAEGVAPRVALAEIAAEIAAAQRAGVPLVAYNAAYDLTLLERELQRHGLATLAERLGRDCMPVVDPLVLDRRLCPDREGPRRLGDLCLAYAVPQQRALHTAEVDVVATLDLLARIAERFPQVARRGLAELHEWQVGLYRDWAENLSRRRLDEGGPACAAVDPGWPMPVGAAAHAAVTGRAGRLPGRVRRRQRPV